LRRSCRAPGGSGETTLETEPHCSAGAGALDSEGLPDPVAPLVFDWNAADRSGPVRRAALLDDTLRDGLQNASVRQPEPSQRVELLHRMAGLGVEAANLGLPAASERAFADCLALCREVSRERLGIRLVVAGRTLERDMQAIVELREASGVAVEGHAFVGSSPIRAEAEGWDLELMKRRTAAAIGVLATAGIPATFVTEDTTRSRPDTLRALFDVALDAGATRLCLCDTVGHATPEGARRLVEFTRAYLTQRGAIAPIDWHGHNDRGLSLANALAAFEAGADRLHATALGIGERVGNTPLELLMLNLWLAGHYPHDLRHLAAYCRRASELLGFRIAANYPLVGDNAFRTATGVHAAAIQKAKRRDGALADGVYSAVPARAFGRAQEICIGAMSGASNVRFWLAERGIPENEELVRAVLSRARASDHILSDGEILEIVQVHSDSSSASRPQGERGRSWR
jgi:2-isopropylmalate synthase